MPEKQRLVLLVLLLVALGGWATLMVLQHLLSWLHLAGQ